MKILVTGGAGFIGSHIVDAYIRLGHSVTVVDNLSTGQEENINPEARFYKLDINDAEVRRLIMAERFDVINHHAAQMDVRVSVNDPIYDAQNNILGGLNIYESAKDAGVGKIIFASSAGTVYGEQLYFPADEEHPTKPCSPYGVAKLANEHYLYYYKKVYGLDYVVLRYTNVYGPRQNPYGEAGVIAIFANKMLRGEQPVINGDGLNTRDYVFVEDVVEANVIVLGENKSNVYNVSTGIEYDVNFVFRKLKELTGAVCDEYHGPAKAGEQRRSCCSYEKFYKEHNWRPKFNFEEGLRLTVDSFRAKV